MIEQVLNDLKKKKTKNIFKLIKFALTNIDNQVERGKEGITLNRKLNYESHKK